MKGALEGLTGNNFTKMIRARMRWEDLLMMESESVHDFIARYDDAKLGMETAGCEMSENSETKYQEYLEKLTPELRKHVMHKEV